MEEPLPEEVQKQPTSNARVGLLLQDKISRLEQELMNLDNEYSRRDADPINNGTFRDDTEEHKFLIQQSQLREYVRAPSQDTESLRTWHANHQNIGIVEEEHSYLGRNQDLIRLRSHEKTPLRN
ncbi:hypothetical protein F5B18DRAFT_651242 [Nemania serpens]|nr:hypothetical protein F5B18DRAFT_651242 [Nemania serpens]